MRRREFIGGLLASGLLAGAAERRGPRILLRSSWQVVNIGDIAHTPGVLALIEKHIPGAETVLWASADFSDEVGAMLKRRFPKLRVVKGTIAENGKASSENLAEAISWCDFLLHGSGPSMVGHRDVAAFVKATGKGFGVYGITYGGFGTAEREILGQAKFAYFRDSVSLERAKADGVAAPVMEFGPDGAFACDLRDDAKAEKFLREAGLEAGKFLCCLSRLRYTPYWTIPEKKVARNEGRHARNEAMKEQDHRALREAIVAVARATDLKVLLCPEDVTQVAVSKEMFWDKLPPDVKQRVVWRDTYWLTDEALSVYVRSAGLFGSEMHSPIMAIGNGVPAIVCRFAEQTSKGIMWRDVGLGDWLFDLDVAADHEKIAPAVLAMARDRLGAAAKVKRAREFVEKLQQESMGIVRKSARI